MVIDSITYTQSCIILWYFALFVFPVPSFEGHQPLGRINYPRGEKRRANAKETLFQPFWAIGDEPPEWGGMALANEQFEVHVSEQARDWQRTSADQPGNSPRQIWKGSKNPTRFGPHIRCAGFLSAPKIICALMFANDVSGLESENEHEMVRRNKLRYEVCC